VAWRGNGSPAFGEGQCAGDGIEAGIKLGAEAAWRSALRQTLVQKPEDGAGVDVGVVNAALRAHDEGAVHGGGKSLADDLAEIEADDAVGEDEEIKEVSADLEEGREAEVDFDGIVTQRRGGDERGLEEPGLAHVVLTDEAAGWRRLVWR
jgi:hypothetical protein